MVRSLLKWKQFQGGLTMLRPLTPGLLAMMMMSCATVREYPISPFTCDYPGGINISNGRMLHIEEVTTSANRPNFLDERKTVKISGQHYSLESFQPILMCVDPELSAELPRQADLAREDILRRYSLFSAALALAPFVPAVIGGVAVAAILPAGALAGAVTFAHQKWFEPNVQKLQDMSVGYNRKLAEYVRRDDRANRYAEFNIKK
jgi:hypothetical protein